MGVDDSNQIAVPREVLDLLRFMCETWSEIDDWAYRRASPNALAFYPNIQGTANKIQLRAIGLQPYDKKSIKTAVDWVLELDQPSNG